MNRNMKRVAVVATPLVAIVAAGVAFAAWTATGAGSGAATATHEVVTVSTATAPAADLFPNGTAGALVVSVNNPNSGPIKVTQIIADPGANAAQLLGGGCSTGNPDLSLNAATISTWISGQTATAMTIAAGGTSSFTIPGAINMGGSANNSCQDASLTYPVQVTAVTP